MILRECHSSIFLGNHCGFKDDVMLFPGLYIRLVMLSCVLCIHVVFICHYVYIS